ncbi:MAG: protoheme IX farnesyltransferase [Bdellovibrionales bacterium RBG_16_40_8]|nr:MAG: protoheme IX farnesyltransferase [Bdellovibrionales bacterium RBG_16_40_8]
MRAYLKLTKASIGIFVLVTGLAGYAVSRSVSEPLNYFDIIIFLTGLYLVSSGSFVLNQAQEWRLDEKMQRTSLRPVPVGEISPWQAYLIGILFCISGLFALYLLEPIAAGLALFTVVLYNGIYTLYCKKKWAFGAVPGAIPGAMPVVIGYSVNSSTLLAPDCIYLFLVMFLWQMPHFWALAVRYKEDYIRGGLPVLPTKIGVKRTLYHVGLYTFAYAGVGMAAPVFINTHIFYVLIIVPLALKVVWEFFRYFRSENSNSWLPFFLWVNLSMLAFICVPALDKWFFHLMISTLIS